MPAGDLVLSDFQFEVRSTLFGFGTSFHLDDRIGIRGLGLPDVKSTDIDYPHTDGAFAGEDFSRPRVLSLPFKIVANSAADAFAALTTATTAWAPATTDIPLYFRVPSWGKVYVNGRPRGLVEDLSKIYRPPVEVPILCTFFCPDPTINTAAP